MRSLSFSHVKIELSPPHVQDKDSYLTGLQELNISSERSAWVYLGDSADNSIPEKNFEDYVSTLLSRENHPPQGFVKDTILWAKADGEIIGRISIRHELNDFLKKVGGHIGYIVRPSWRGRGVASEMLRQILNTDRAREVGHLLLTCDETNIASEKSILKNGGLFEGYVDMGPSKPRKKRFWITVGTQS